MDIRIQLTTIRIRLPTAKAAAPALQDLHTTIPITTATTVRMVSAIPSARFSPAMRTITTVAHRAAALPATAEPTLHHHLRAALLQEAVHLPVAAAAVV